MPNKGVKPLRGLSSVTRRFFHPGLAILLGLAVAGPFATSRAVAQIVERTIPEDPVVVDGGALSGKLLESGVRAYFGVPFAAPPVRDLRWARATAGRGMEGRLPRGPQGAGMHPGAKTP
jgi:hypothetical protein